MSKDDRVVFLRVPAELHTRLRKAALKLSSIDRHGAQVSMNVAARMFIEEGVSGVEQLSNDPTT